jgi:1-aminocyclopropane-1-carboxylate deaminase
MIQPVKDPELVPAGQSWDVLRLDTLHPVVSGNKWFKLGPWIDTALREAYDGLASFGGAWSNHLHALAWAAREAGLRSVGYVRGNPPPGRNPMLDDLQSWGMDLHFLPRQAFDALAWDTPEQAGEGLHQDRLPEPLRSLQDHGRFLVVPAGGYGTNGMLGAARIWEHIPPGSYTHIYCAVGSGTMMAGLLAGAHDGSSGTSPIITGIPVLQDRDTLEPAIRALLPADKGGISIPLDHRHHGGGYTKMPPGLLAFMDFFYDRTGIPTDIIYTAKLMYAISRLFAEGAFPPGSRVLAVHSGGLQGNRSLPPGSLRW